jgi:ribonuclease P protein component
MLGRIVRPADFERLLAVPPKARSAHFAAHHVAGVPSTARAARPDAAKAMLSTDDPRTCEQPVDDGPQPGPGGCWLGVAVPKRHAREATTRNLLKRQIRACVRACEPELPRGLWLVRLRVPFDRRRLVSPASAALRLQARQELQQLLRRACA